MHGLKDGFWVGFDHLQYNCKKAKQNMASTREKSEEVRDYLSKECAEGWVLGPLDPDLYPAVQVSQFGVIPKGTTGKWHLIVDFSAPEGHSVNDGIRREWCSLTYVSVDDAVAAVRQLGRGSLLAKVDIRSAYRIVPVHPTTDRCWA